MRKRRSEPWEQVGSSSQPVADLGGQAGAYLVGAPQECLVTDASAAVHRRLPQMCGGGLGEEEGGDPSELGEGGEACLCDGMLPGGGRKEMGGAHLDDIQH